MTNFVKFREAVNRQLDIMIATGAELFEVDLEKNDLWELYLASFPQGTNPIYRERTEHDCQCCKQFIRDLGKIVAVKNGVMSIWDISLNDNTYQPVADALSELVKSAPIKNVYRHYQQNVGTAKNYETDDKGKVTIWEHFHYKLPTKLVLPKKDIATYLGKTRTNYEVLQRSVDEITADAIDVVLELIDQNSLYRGSEHRATVAKLQKVKKAYDKITEPQAKTLFLVNKAAELKEAGRFKNTVIGTLLTDISSGVELTKAVKSFEDKVAPANYKRPTALVTQSMITQAQNKVEELGLSDALHRRFATTQDLTVNNVLFADRSTKSVMEGTVFDGLSPTKANKPKFNNLTEVSIEDFIAKILPKAETIELMMENSHTGNLVSLIAPVDPDAPNLFKWDNNFSWSYNGEVADSMKERVKAAGGDVTGVLRYSIQWNEENKDPERDFDAHCIEPNKNLIYYGNKRKKHLSSGMLDVDIISPGSKPAVENITWSNKDKMQEGVYTFIVHNFSSAASTEGFTAEIEYDGVIHSFNYNSPLKGNQKVQVAKVKFSKTNGIELVESLSSQASTKNVWGLDTQQFHKVAMVMASPNHWDEQEVGNKHWFFILEDCLNPDSARGFYNEFLRGDLTEHRKVFELLSAKLKASESDNQLSGLGFSSTQRNSVVCKISGAFNRTVKINF